MPDRSLKLAGEIGEVIAVPDEDCDTREFLHALQQEAHLRLQVQGIADTPEALLFETMLVTALNPDISAIEAKRRVDALSSCAMVLESLNGRHKMKSTDRANPADLLLEAQKRAQVVESE